MTTETIVAPLEDDIVFDIASLNRARASGRHLFGRAAEILCDVSNEKDPAAGPQRTGLLGRILKSGRSRSPAQAAMIRWIEGAEAFPPELDIPRYAPVYDPKVMRMARTALHPDAPWDAEAAHRFGSFLQLHNHSSRGKLANIGSTDAFLALLGVTNGWPRTAHTRKDRWNVPEERQAPALVLDFAKMCSFLEMDRIDAIRFVVSKPGITRDLPGYRDAFAASVPGLLQAYRNADLEERVGLLSDARVFRLLPEFDEIVFGMAAASKVKDRARAEAYVQDFPAERLKSGVEAVAPGFTPAQRAALYEMLGALRLEEAVPLFEAWVADETGAKPKDVMERALARAALARSGDDAGDGGDGYVAVDGTRVTLPPYTPSGDPHDPQDAVLDPIREAVAQYNRSIDALNDAALARAKERNVELKARGKETYTPSLKEHISDAQIAETMIVMRGGERTLLGEDKRRRPLTPATRTLASSVEYSYERISFDVSLLTAFLDREDLHWRHVARLSNPSGYRYDSLANASTDDRHTPEGALWRRIHGGVHLLDVLHHHPDAITTHRGWRMRWEDHGYDDLWVAFLPHLDKIVETLSRSERGDEAVREAMDMLAQFPKLPLAAVPDLLRIALGPQRSWRGQAQMLLGDSAQVTPMIVERLSDGKVDIRASAALWLGRRGDVSVIPAIEARLKKERAEIGRAALMTALRALGGDLAPWLDRAALQKEAEKALPKLKMDAIAWLLPGLPTDLVWAGGEPVSPEILQYWAGLAVKLKQPGGNGLFGLWLDALAPDSAARLGQFVLASWLHRDVEPPTEAEAQAHAATTLRQRRQYWWTLSKDMQSASDEECLAFIANEHRRTALAGAADSKGVLALAMRASGAEGAAAARAYLKKHGRRVSQAKAVVECMAANPHPAAIQVVIGVADRFRQKTVHKLAQDLIERIAEDRGWSADELADRTIPNGGFDANGEMALDAGRGRVFTARLGDDGSIALFNPDGKAVKNLPAPSGSEDDIASGKEAKKALSAARKEIKQVAEQLTLRFYEAMCLERVWPLADWRDCLQLHPLAGRLCQKLVWMGLDANGEAVRVFRTMDDTSLTDHEDNPVEPDFAHVRLVHGGLLDPETRAAWKEHLSDYEIEPLFDQFHDPIPLAEADATGTEIRDRLGWTLESFALKGATKKLHYERGPVLDGGGFDCYVKHFHNAGLVVELSCSGQGMGQPNTEVALLEAKVRRLRGDAYGPALRLGDVPPPLLTAVRSDLATIAAVGSGYSEDYERLGW